MGCDWHPHFYHFVDGKSEMLFQPIPHPDYWYESILERKIEDGSIAVLIGNVTDDANLNYQAYRDFGTEYLTSRSTEEIIARYFDDPDMLYEWNHPELEDGRWPVRIRSRDYDWFGAIADVRGDLVPGCMVPRGLPDDLPHMIKKDFDRNDGDYHSHSWYYVSDLINNPHLSTSIQTRWMKTFIPEPTKTVLVFAFDN